MASHLGKPLRAPPDEAPERARCGSQDLASVQPQHRPKRQAGCSASWAATRWQAGLGGGESAPESIPEAEGEGGLRFGNPVNDDLSEARQERQDGLQFCERQVLAGAARLPSPKGRNACFCSLVAVSCRPGLNDSGSGHTRGSWFIPLM